MKKLFALLALLFAVNAYGQVISNSPPPGVVLKDEGSTQGRVTIIDCVGGGIACTKSGSTGTLTVSGGGSGGTAGSPLYVTTATATAVTSTSETTIIGSGVGSLTIPAAWFTSNGTVLDVHASGKFSTGAVPGTLTIKLKFGSTVVGQTAAFTPLVSVTDGVFAIWLRLVARTIGASGTILITDILPMTGTTLTPGEVIFANPTLGTAVTVDTTVTNAVDLTATWGTGATNSITGMTFEMWGPGSAVSSVFGRTGAVLAANNDYSFSQISGSLACSQHPALTGDVTTSAGSCVTTLANIPTATPAAGSIIHTNIAAPASPAAGKVSTFSDSTDLRFHDKNASGVIGTTVVADTGASNNFLTAISAAGAISKAQPAFSNLSGTATDAQIPDLIGLSTGLTASRCVRTDTGPNLASASQDCVTASSTETFTNKTLDAEGTGNVLTLPFTLWVGMAGCTGTTAGTIWDLPTTNPMVATCTEGTNTVQGYGAFADGASVISAQYNWAIPSDWTGNVDVALKWFTTATSGNVVWQVATVCVADAATNDPAFNTASTVTDAAKGTTLQLNDATITSLTVTGCTAGSLMHIKVLRDPAHASDTLAATANLIGIELKYRRAI